MQKFQVGDRIKSDYYENKGMFGTIVSPFMYGVWNIQWDDGRNYGSNNRFCERLLILVSSANQSMNSTEELVKLTPEQEEGLTEVNKPLVKAGLIDSKLQMTGEGQRALIALLFKQNKETLSKNAAEQIAKLERAEKEAAKKRA